MEQKLYYSFDDEPVSKFCYDIVNKKIEIYLNGYYDMRNKGILIEQPCIYIIENWKEAKSKVGDEEKLYDLNKHMGIFSMILFMKWQGDDFEMFISTLDNRYITLIFKEPKLSLR